VFLDTVRSFSFLKIGVKKPIVHHKLKEMKTDTLTLPMLGEACHRTILKDSGSTRFWERYVVDRKMPSHLRRRHKARENTTPIGIALPSEGDSGKIYAGLPLGVSTGLPFSMNAQFDSNVARTEIQHEPLNSWLLDRVGELIASVALHRLYSQDWRLSHQAVE
jgi:hypothetical protein